MKPSRPQLLRGKKNQPGSAENIYGNKGTDAITAASEKYFGDAGDKMHHSRYYHRYYEGYTEVRTENPGNPFVPYKIKRIYTAPYTVVDMGTEIYWVYMLCYGLLTAVGILLYLSAMTDPDVSMNLSKVSALAVILTLVPLLVLTASLLGYYFRPKKMKCYDFRSSTGRLKFWSVAAAAGCVLTVLIFVVFLLAAGSANLFAELLYIGKLLLASGAYISIFLLERRMRYKQEPNDAVLPEGEYHRIQ